MRITPSACHPERSEGPAFAFGLFTILLLAIFSLGCAVPGEPLPPLLEIPAPVTDLTAQQVGDTLRVTIPVPRLTTEGTLPKHLERIELFVTYAPPAAAQPEFAAPAEQVWNAGDLRDGSAVLSQIGRAHV